MSKEYNFFVSYSYKTAEGSINFGKTFFTLSSRRPRQEDIYAFEDVIHMENPSFSDITVLNVQKMRY